MHKIIIPLDFSETSFHAARFAASMLAGQEDSTVILYHKYEHDHEYDNSKELLESLKSELLEKGDHAVEYELQKGGDLVDNLDKLAHTRRATLIVMGITGRNELQQRLIGSNTLKTVDTCLYPVMIVPPDAEFNGIKHVGFASDFKDVEASTPAALLNAILELFNPLLHIINVNPAHYVSPTEEAKAQQDKLDEMFAQYKKKFYFLDLYNFHEAVHNFLADNSIDILITIPHHLAGHPSLWHQSNTQKLAYHTHIPLLTAHP